LQPSVARKVLRRLRDREAEANAAAVRVSQVPTLSARDPLTAREVEVLRLVGTGAANREIAEALCLTEGTVKNYLSSILDKTGLRDRTQAAIFAVRHGLADG